MKNIHIVQTDKLTKLGRFTDTHNFYLRTNDDIPRGENVNIYITSDEEIKKGDWFITTDSNEIHKSDWIKFHFDNGRKIILTTDQDLINDGIQAIDDEFLEWLVKNSSCEEVEVKATWYSDIKSFKAIINKIIIPKDTTKYPIGGYAPGHYTCTCVNCNEQFMGDKRAVQCESCACNVIKEEPKQTLEKYSERFDNDKSPIGNPETWGKRIAIESKQETLQKAAKRYAEEYKGEDQDPWFDFMEGAKWQQERSYSEEDLRKAFTDGYGITVTSSLNDAFEKWIEQFKK